VQTFRRQAPVVDRLKSVGQFRAYKKAQLREVARLAEQVKVGEGEILVREGQFGKEFFLILSGTVEVTQKGRLVNALGPGDFFGELAALNRGPRNATVRALSDLDLLIIGRREFNAMLQIPEFRDALLKRMVSRLQTVDAQLATALDGQKPGLSSASRD
jgi:CRP/FNR family transcriptional regulator, cyclic AMP receptor protein